MSSLSSSLSVLSSWSSASRPHPASAGRRATPTPRNRLPCVADVRLASTSVLHRRLGSRGVLRRREPGSRRDGQGGDHAGHLSELAHDVVTPVGQRRHLGPRPPRASCAHVRGCLLPRRRPLRSPAAPLRSLWDSRSCASRCSSATSAATCSRSTRAPASASRSARPARSSASAWTRSAACWSPRPPRRPRLAAARRPSRPGTSVRARHAHLVVLRRACSVRSTSLAVHCLHDGLQPPPRPREMPGGCRRDRPPRCAVAPPPRRPTVRRRSCVVHSVCSAADAS